LKLERKAEVEKRKAETNRSIRTMNLKMTRGDDRPTSLHTPAFSRGGGALCAIRKLLRPSFHFCFPTLISGFRFQVLNLIFSFRFPFSAFNLCLFAARNFLFPSLISSFRFQVSGLIFSFRFPLSAFRFSLPV